MSLRRVLLVGLVATITCAALPGCGGEGGVVVTVTGVYAGNMDGDGQGPLRFFIGPGGALTGNFRLPPVCNGPVHITGTVTPNGQVTFQGTACGITFNGTGTVQRVAPGSSQFSGSGTWTGSNGTSGTWQVDRIGRTGSISV